MYTSAERLFQGIIWPAVAGNVAWAFISVLLLENTFDGYFAARLALLFWASVYLGADWLLTERKLAHFRLKPWFFLFEGPLAAAIAVLAIVTQGRPDSKDIHYIEYALGAIFLIAACGHVFGAWEPMATRTASRDQWLSRMLFAAGNLFGLALLVLLAWSGTVHHIWIPIMAVVTYGFVIFNTFSELLWNSPWS